MSTSNIHAYIDVPSHGAVFDLLNPCTTPDSYKRLFIAGVSGSGRSTLLQHWAIHPARREHVVMVKLVPIPRIPIFYVACSLLWYQLRYLDA